jgi:hypothetical protein
MCNTRGADGFTKVILGHAQIVLYCHRLAVAEPGTNNVSGELICQFSLPRGSKIVEQLGPRLDPGTLDNPSHPRVQICPCPVSRDHEFRALCGLVEYFRKGMPQFRKQGDDAALLARMMFRFWATDGHPVAFPIHIGPT